ncbi:hypothetical protein EBB05_30410, partial (plasmid) [Methylobacterium brachiatum]
MLRPRSKPWPPDPNQTASGKPGAVQLDDVRVLIDVTTMDGDTIAAGTEGTVVAVWKGGAAYEIE